MFSTLLRDNRSLKKGYALLNSVKAFESGGIGGVVAPSGKIDLTPPAPGQTAVFSKVSTNNGVVSFFTAITAISTGAYVVLLSHAPGLSTIFSNSLALGIIVVVAIMALLQPVMLLSRTVLVVYMFIAAGMHILDGESVQWEALFRYTLSILSLTFLLRAPIIDKRHLLSWISALIIANACLVAAIGGMVVYAGTLRIMPFFGDVSAVHASALVVLAAGLTIWFSPWSSRCRFFWAAISCVLLVGYGTASEMVMLALFVAAQMLRRFKVPRIWIIPIGAVAIGSALLYRNLNSLQGATIQKLGSDAAGSGRWGTWSERADIFIRYDWIFKIIGTGPYSDYRVSDIWWWEPKSAHNDWITMLMEFGVVGLVLLALYFMNTSRYVGYNGKYIMLIVAMGMMLTNSTLDRPSVTVIWGFALYSSQFARCKKLSRVASDRYQIA